MKLIVIIGVMILAGCSARSGHPVIPSGPMGLEAIATASIDIREKLGGQSEFVTGQSMLPIFGSRTMLVHTYAWPVKRGQLVVFRYEGKLYFHQVIDTHEEQFLTKGINNNEPDPWLSKRHYVGTVYWAGWFGNSNNSPL